MEKSEENKKKKKDIKVISKHKQKEIEQQKIEQEKIDNNKQIKEEKHKEKKSEKTDKSESENSDIVLGKDLNLLEKKRKESQALLEKIQEKNKWKKIFTWENTKKVFLWLAYFWGILFVVPALLMILGILNVFPQDSSLFGFDLIPVVYLWYPFWIALICSLISQKFKISIFFAILMVILLFTTTDCNLFYKDKTARNQKALGKTYTAATLNTAQYDKGVVEIWKSFNKISPDFIFLQEVNFPVEVGVANTKMAFPDYHMQYGKSDNIILSKYPIIEFHEIALPSRQPGYIDNTPENNKNNAFRYFQHAVINDNGTKINLLCLRLIAGRSKDFGKSPSECIEWGQYLARVQMKESAFMRQYIEKLQGPCIFGGDMNAPPYALSMKDIYAVGIDTARATKFIPDPTFPAKGPNQRLDYMFCSKHFKADQTEVQKDVISDHRCVLAKLTLLEEKKYDIKTYKKDIKNIEKKKADKKASEKSQTTNKTKK